MITPIPREFEVVWGDRRGKVKRIRITGNNRKGETVRRYKWLSRDEGESIGTEFEASDPAILRSIIKKGSCIETGSY